MKLIFKKGEDAQINVFHFANGQEKDFAYVDMIKALICSKELAEPDIIGGFSEAEKKSIESMVTLINQEVSVLNESTCS